MIDNISIAVYAFASRILVFSVDKTLLLRLVNLSTSEPPFSVEMSRLWLKHMYSLTQTVDR